MGMWDVGDVGWLECVLVVMCDVEDMAYSGYGLFGM